MKWFLHKTTDTQPSSCHVKFVFNLVCVCVRAHEAHTHWVILNCSQLQPSLKDEKSNQTGAHCKPKIPNSEWHLQFRGSATFLNRLADRDTLGSCIYAWHPVAQPSATAQCSCQPIWNCKCQLIWGGGVFKNPDLACMPEFGDPWCAIFLKLY